MKGACPQCGATDRLSTIENVEAYLPVECELDEFGAAYTEYVSDRDVEYGDSYDSSVGMRSRRWTRSPRWSMPRWRPGRESLPKTPAADALGLPGWTP